MNLITYVFLGYVVAALGSVTPSFLNLTIVKTSLKYGRKSALLLVVGFATVLFFQANIGAYLSNVLMENSKYIAFIQALGTGILILLSINFFRLHFKETRKVKGQNTNKVGFYFQGIGMALLNTFAVPFYFTTISLLIGMNYFTYSFTNNLCFTIGSTAGSFTVYGMYAVVASNIKDRLTSVSAKINLILGGGNRCCRYCKFRLFNLLVFPMIVKCVCLLVVLCQ